jgi:Right handed beta helix region
MKPDPENRSLERSTLLLRLILAALTATSLLAADGTKLLAPVPAQDDGAFHVHAGMSIQDAVEKAAAHPTMKIVKVHEGTYRPTEARQALVWFNARHDGITLEAVGEVILTAENPEIADRSMPSYPAVVNHVVYFGDGISRSTVLRGFQITGANDFYADAGVVGASIEPALGSIPALREHRFFYSDGGAIKIFGRSYPIIENIEIYGNYAAPCGAGISVDHRGFTQDEALIRNCIIRDNHSAETGAAVDLLPGSAAVIENCLFVGNISNLGTRGEPKGKYSTNYNKEHGSGALTVFPGSRCTVRNSTFTRNWNGVDDKGPGNVYEHNIFWNNTAGGGIAPGDRYELDIMNGRSVAGCLINGKIDDLRGSVDSGRNVLGAPDPDFDKQFRPRAKAYQGVGYRPATEPE